MSTASSPGPPAAHVRLAASSQTAEGGEGGESGEGGAAAAGEAGFLAQLGIVEGHLRAGGALYEAGGAEMAKTHMKHPGDEICTDLAPKLEAHGARQPRIARCGSTSTPRSGSASACRAGRS